MARYLFDSWPQAAPLLESTQHFALFLDLDGTLVPLQMRPSDVLPLDAHLHSLLARLAAHPRGHVYVISGRGLEDLRRLVKVPGVRLLGMHGWEGREVPALEEERNLLRLTKRQLSERLPDDLQIYIEDKGLGIAVHYRGSPPDAVPVAYGIVKEVLHSLGPRIHLVRGHKLWEILPRQIDGKGPAVTALLSTLPPSTLPLYVGDDITDESAFRALEHGLTVHVGANQHTHARFYVRNPDEVRSLLERLMEGVTAQ